MTTLYPIFRSCQPVGLSQLAVCSRLRRSPHFCTISQPPCIRNAGQAHHRLSFHFRTEKITRLFASASDTEDKPAVPHIPVLLAEILALFHDTHTRVYVDGTLGAGGHASAIAGAHPEMETLIGFDMDPLAHEIAHERLTSIIPEDATIVHVRSNFRNLSSALSDISPGLEEGGVDAMLLDLGISSMQVDTADRGFSFGADGPIDMRMDPTANLRAEQIVNDYPEAELANIIFKYGEEKRARNIAQRIVKARPIQTTAELVQAIGGPAGRYVKVKGGERKRTIHPATRTFQALRIAVNDELGALEQVLPAAINCLAPGGRLGVISFHSLEDRMVKQAFRKAAGKAEVEIGNKYDQWCLPPKSPEPKVKIITKRPIVAEEQERSENPRSRSAKLRFIEKL